MKETQEEDEEYEELSPIKKALPAITVGAILIGILMGKSNTNLAIALSPYMTIALMMQVFPSMVQVDFGKIKNAFRGGKKLYIAPFCNYIICPFLIFILGHIFLPDEPYLQTGLILAGLLPCFSMINGWVDYAGGNINLSATVSAIDSILQIVLTPFYITLLIWSVPYDHSLVFNLLITYLIVPLVLGFIVRTFVIEMSGREGMRALKPILEIIENLGFVFTLSLLFATEGQHVFSNPWHLIRIAVPLIIFYYLRFYISFETSRRFDLTYGEAIAVAFNGSGIHFELALAIAISAFHPKVAEACVMAPMLEVPMMLLLFRYAENNRCSFRQKSNGNKMNCNIASSLKRRSAARLLMRHLDYDKSEKL